MTTFLCTPPDYIRSFIHQADKDYFSKPIPVEVHYTDDVGLVHVTDHARGHSYPVAARNLTPLNRMPREFREAWAKANPTTK